MVNRKILTSLGLTSAWFDWGLLTTDQAEELLAEYQTSDDKRSEHYRWRAFDRFMNDNLELDPIIIHRIYDLAKEEQDEMLQDSMIHLLIRRDDVPIDLLVKEASSRVRSIAKKAKEKIAEKETAKPEMPPIVRKSSTDQLL